MDPKQIKSGAKRRHVTLTIANKLKVIEQLEKGVPGKKIAQEFGIGPQTVSDIKKKKEDIKAFALKFDVQSSKSSVCNRQTLKKPKEIWLEEAVYMWYVQQRSNGVTVRGVELQAVAERIAKHFELQNFSCSSGWLWRFRQRHNITNMKYSGSVDDNLIGDAENVEVFRKKLNEIIAQSGLCHSQIYNADETGLFWRAFPENSFQTSCAAKLRKKARDRLSALLCANADGSHRLKSVLIDAPKNATALNDFLPTSPVIYYSKNACFTPEIIRDWFHTHFVPEVVKHQKEVLKLSDDQIKAVLLVDNAPEHRDILYALSEDGKIKCLVLPPYTYSLVQPMDQGIMTTCKRLYKRKVLDEVLVPLKDAKDEDSRRQRKTLKNIKLYDIKSAILNWTNAWNDIEDKIIANCWKKILLGTDCGFDFEGIETEDFVKAFRTVGETRVTHQNVQDWLDLDEGYSGVHQLAENDISTDAANVSAMEDDSDKNDPSVDEPKKKRLCSARDGIDAVLDYVTSSSNPELQAQYDNLLTVKEIIIKEQRQKYILSLNL